MLGRLSFPTTEPPVTAPSHATVGASGLYTPEGRVEGAREGTAHVSSPSLLTAGEAAVTSSLLIGSAKRLFLGVV